MKKVLLAGLAAAALAVVGLVAVTLTTPSAQAVGCPPANGPITNIFCGELANIECPGNLVCVDDPRDNCCPQLGGADCGGVCAPQRRR